MNQHRNFTRKSFLQRFIISQVLLITAISSVIAISNKQPRQQTKTDADKSASKKNLAKATIILHK